MQTRREYRISVTATDILGDVRTRLGVRTNLHLMDIVLSILAKESERVYLQQMCVNKMTKCESENVYARMCGCADVCMQQMSSKAGEV